MLTRCRACLLPVLWWESVYGRLIALDPVPTPDGDVVLDPWDRKARPASRGYRIDLPHYRRHACAGKSRRLDRRRRKPKNIEARSYETHH